MGLRTTTLTAGDPAAPRTQEEWRRRVEDTIDAASAAIAAGSNADLRTTFASLADWGDPQRAYQARRRLAELVFSAGERLGGDAWPALYATAAEALLDALAADPREPVLLNYAGVLLYELTELGGAQALFRAAAGLDASLPHVQENLEAVRLRKSVGSRPVLRPPLSIRVKALGRRARRVAKAAAPAAGLTLTLCMIVKDEEEMLPGCLDAVRDAVDEIIVVDTGSSDRTVELAECAGAKVVHVPWNGSFADARNVSLEHATGDWILYLDADEHVVPEDAKGLRQLLGRTWREAFYLVETNYTGGDESGAAVTHLALRLFRNRPGYRFEGRIHEQKSQTMPTYLPERFETTTIRVRHYGYLVSRISAKDKSRRNLELLEAEAPEQRTAFSLFNLGSEYLGLGDSAKARAHLDEAWRLACEAKRFGEGGYVPLLASRVAKARRETADYDGARAAIDEALTHYPDHTDLVFEAAVCAWKSGNRDEAARLAERCLEMGDAPARYSATVGSGTYLALNLLAELHAVAGRTAEAEALRRRSLAEHPDYLAPVLPLAASMLARGASPEDVAGEVPSHKPSALLLLATACYEAGHAEAAERWFRSVLERQPANGAARIGLIEALLTQRRYDEAVTEAAAEPPGSPIHALASLAELFGLAIQSRPEELGRALRRAEEAGVPRHELDLYRAWQQALAGGPVPTALSASVAGPAATALEALLRVQEFESFATLLPLYESTAVQPRERKETLARIYFRRGFLESAADEWIEIAQQAPDARAMIGLAHVALARGFDEDALAFAREAVAIDPDGPESRGLYDAIARRARPAVEEAIA